MTKKLTIDILAKDKTKQALTGVQKNLNNVKKSVFSLRGALVGLGAGAIVKSFVDVGKEVESLQVRFKFLFGSIEEGKVAFNSLTEFAGRVPFSLEEISRASGNLAVVAKDAQDLTRVLEITGNVAAVTGLDFETTSSQIQRAFSGGIGAADLFRERGVRALLGFQAGAKVTAEETIARFEELFAGDGQFARATTDLASTLEGTLSMIGDKYFKFQKDVAAGFFDELKGEFGDLNKFLEENEQQIKDIATAIGENFAGALTTTSSLIKATAPSVKTIANALGTTVEGFKSLPDYVKTGGIIGVMLFGKKGALALGAISFLLGQVEELMDRTKELGGLKGLSFSDLEKSLPTLESARTALEAFEKTYLTQLNSTNRLTNEQKVLYENLKELVDLREEEASILRMANADAQSYIAIQKSITKTIKEQKEEYKSKVDIDQILADNEVRIQKRKHQEMLDAQKSFDAEMRRRRSAEIIFAKMEADRKAELEKQGQRQIVDAVGDGLSKVAGLNKDAFRAYQAFQIAMTTINTFRAASNALATYPFPLNIGVAAAETARGLATVAQIRATPAPRIAGGRVNAGEPYMVGEAGKEMFVPQQSGTIVPNNQLTSPNVNITIMANDTEGFDDLLLKRRSVIVNVINDALNTQGKEALI